MYSNIAESSQKPKTKLSVKTVNGLNPLTIFAKSPIPGVRRVLSMPRDLLLCISIYESDLPKYFSYKTYIK